MAVRSKLLAAYVTVGSGNVSIYTVPAGETALLKQLSIVNTQQGLPQSCTVRATINGTDKIFVSRQIAGGEDEQISLFHCFPPGVVIKVGAPVAGVHFLLSGAELEGVAD